MRFKRGDIVKVFFDLPYTTASKLHPAIILSNEDVHNTDDVYIGVMMTSNGNEDMFSFIIDDTMLSSPNNKDHSQARTHLITYFMPKNIHSQTPMNTMKPSSVNRLVERINETSIVEDID